MNGALDTYLQETLGGHQSTLQKNREKVGKIEETWVRTKPKNSTTFLRGRKNNKRKGRVTKENDLHAKQPLFIQKY